MNPLTIIPPKSEVLTAARKLVPPPGPNHRSEMRLTDGNGITQDIIDTITAVFRKSYRDTAKLAPQLRGRDAADTFRRVWAFARHQITYVLDNPPGDQFVKTPRMVIVTGFCDCKGLSILVNSLLVNLGYKPSFKYAGYVPGGDVTHVYTQIEEAGQTYILDACMHAFNTEKPYATTKLVPAL